MAPALVVFSHLRWNFVYQRPQHLLSRLARKRRVLFLEEPVHDVKRGPHWEKTSPQSNVQVCRAHTPHVESGFVDGHIATLRRLLADLMIEEGVDDHVLWFYSPMAMPLAQDLRPRAIVYDCMDELSAFLHAPAQLLQREADLFAQADLVFTGGPSLYHLKKDRHPSVHCFPSSVDAAHFRPNEQRPQPADQAAIPRPRLGYFGVMDERLDWDLLKDVAARRPDWQFILIGPMAKIDAARLPRGENLHYLGPRDYAQLPDYVAGWDVCLLPFARNHATRYISPTKTLEYMAAERPIVSTPITDIAEPYGHIVHLGDSPADFAAACETALSLSPAKWAERRERMRRVLRRTSWDDTAAAMERLLDQVVARRTRTVPKARPSTRTTPHVVIGAGPTGLSAAYNLGKDALLLEQNDTVGGWCRSVRRDGFTFDYAGHIMFSNDPYVHDMYEKLLGDNVHWQDREAWIYSKGVYTRYPFQGALYGLPADVIKECVVGAIEARFGSLKGHGRTPLVGRNGNGNGNGHNNGNPACDRGIKDCCADGILESTAPLGTTGPRPPENFEEFIYQVWGAGIARHFAVPYNRKLWAVPLNEMETSWLGGRVPLPDLEEMIEGALRPVARPMGPNARFGYPLRGGFQALMNGFLPLLQGELRLGARVVAVSPGRRTLTLADGEEIGYEQLINTMPLPTLIRRMGAEVPEEVRSAAAALRHVSVRCVHLGVGREKLTDKHWIYYPEETVFHRIFVQGNASPLCNPPGGFGLTCEITYSPHKPLPCDGPELIQRCIDDCRQVGLIGPNDPIPVALQCDLPFAYVVYDHARARNVKLIRSWLDEQGILLAGRYSEWEYYNSDHAFLAGKKAAERVRERQGNAVAQSSGGEEARGESIA